MYIYTKIFQTKILVATIPSSYYVYSMLYQPTELKQPMYIFINVQLLRVKDGMNIHSKGTDAYVPILLCTFNNYNNNYAFHNFHLRVT